MANRGRADINIGILGTPFDLATNNEEVVKSRNSFEITQAFLAKENYPRHVPT